MTGVIKELVWFLPLVVVVIGGLLAVRFLLPQLWAVARNTVAEALRMKIAVFFIVLMVIGFWAATRTHGDGSVSGRVQAFLVYSLTTIGVLLSLLSIFLARSLSDELVHRQILMLMSKSLSRWQYLLGKWLGICLLNGSILAVTGLGIYLTVVLYLAQQPPLNEYDAARLHNEVLLARHATPFSPPEDQFALEINRIYTRDQEEGVHQLREKFDPAKEKANIRKYVEARWRYIPYGQYRTFEFNNVLCQRESRLLFSAKIDENFGAELDRNRMPGTWPEEFAANGLQFSDYATVSTAEPGRVWMVADGSQMYTLTRAGEFSLDVSRVPMIQIRYKAQATRTPPDEILRSQWVAGNPDKGTAVYNQFRRDIQGRYHLLAFPADAVAEDRTLEVNCVNANPYPGEVPFDTVLVFEGSRAVEVLFPVGNFGGNLIRLLVMIQCKLMFLAAAALLFTTVFSFPVACLCALTAFSLAAMQGFLIEAIEGLEAEGASGLLQTVLPWILSGLYLLIPDFSAFSGTEVLAEGRVVTLAWMLQAMLYMVLISTTLALTVACVLFYRREVSEVSI